MLSPSVKLALVNRLWVLVLQSMAPASLSFPNMLVIAPKAFRSSQRDNRTLSECHLDIYIAPVESWVVDKVPAMSSGGIVWKGVFSPR